jgi:hypothetical protein
MMMRSKCLWKIGDSGAAIKQKFLFCVHCNLKDVTRPVFDTPVFLLGKTWKLLPSKSSEWFFL